MSEFKSKSKDAFLSSIPTVSIDKKEDLLTSRCKFNFHYMDFSQAAGQKFEDWTHKQLSELLNKLKNYCERSLFYWSQQPIGKGKSHGKKRNKVLEIYGNFPPKSKTLFKHPMHVPHQAKWARFRLESDSRLAGFVIPPEYDGMEHNGTKKRFDCNTFYVVFLDQNHKFYNSNL